MARGAGALVLLAMAIVLATAAAQPCIQCSDCFTSNCWRNCQSVCPQYPYRPSDIPVSGDACKSGGKRLGSSASQSACNTAMKYCNGGERQSSLVMARRGVGTTSLSQCANIAVGACQQSANNVWGSACGELLSTGYEQCSGSDFRSFYEGEVQELCTNLARDVTGVEPGTNQWAGQQGGWGGQQGGGGYNNQNNGGGWGSGWGGLLGGNGGGLLGGAGGLLGGGGGGGSPGIFVGLNIPTGGGGGLGSRPSSNGNNGGGGILSTISLAVPKPNAKGSRSKGTGQKGEGQKGAAAPAPVVGAEKAVPVNSKANEPEARPAGRRMMAA